MSINACLDAVEREQRAWQALEGWLPGMPGCSPALWSEWVEATAQLNAEVARYIQVKPAPRPAHEYVRHERARVA